MLITGGCGFIGSNFVQYQIKKGNTVLNFDKLTYAGCIESLESIKNHPNYSFYQGDIINGEHVARATSLPWGFIYSNPESLSNRIYGLGRSHPAVGYEMIWDFIVLAMIWPMRNRLRPDGMVFALYLGLYAIGRFFISFVRNDKGWLFNLDLAQLVSLAVLSIVAFLLITKAQLTKPPPPDQEHIVSESNE